MCLFFAGIPLFLSFFRAIDGMFRHIDGNLFQLTVLQCCLAGQLKVAMRGQRLFNPVDGTADCAFGAAVVDADVFHRSVFSVVLQGDEQFIADRKVGRFAAGLVQFVVGDLQDVCHSLKDGFFGADDPFEWCIGQLEGFFGSFHEFFLDAGSKIGYTVRTVTIFGVFGKIKKETKKVICTV